MIPLILEEEGSMIVHHLQEEVDIVDLGLEIEDRVQVLETKGARIPEDLKIGNKFRHLSLKPLCLIQPILLVMFQRYIINIRYNK